MQILSIEREQTQRSRIRCALDLTGKPYELCEISVLRELEPSLDLSNLRLALVGTKEMTEALSAIIVLRGRMPSGNIIAYGEFNAMDHDTPARIRAAGADVVLDSRFSASKMAIMIDRFAWDVRPAESSLENLPTRILRQAIGSIAPAALATD